jgi:hypothetical protein
LQTTTKQTPSSLHPRVTYSGYASTSLPVIPKRGRLARFFWAAELNDVPLMANGTVCAMDNGHDAGKQDKPAVPPPL